MQTIKNIFIYTGELILKVLEWIWNNYTLLFNIGFYVVVFILIYPMNKIFFAGIIISHMVIEFFKYIFKREKEQENKFPTVNKRFTKKYEDGSVRIKRMDWEEAIMYLYEIEQYIGK